MAIANRARLLAFPAFALLAAAQPPSVTGFEGMDRTVAPGDDFYRFANGAWLDNAAILEDVESAGVTDRLRTLTTRRIASIIDDTAKAAPGTEARKIWDFYSSFLDEAAIETRGIQPLQPFLEEIRQVVDRRSLSRLLGATQTGPGGLLGLFVGPDPDVPARSVPFLDQGGLGLPDRRYYLDESEAMRTLRTRYLAYITALMTLVQEKDAGSRAAKVLALETRIARVHWDQVDARDAVKGNNPWSRKEFETKAPGLDWEAFFKAALLPTQDTFVVAQPSAVIGIAALMGGEPLDGLKDWLLFHAIRKRTACLPRAFVKASHQFHSKVLNGSTGFPSRWERGVAVTNAALGQAIGKLYVMDYCPPGEKARARAMVDTLLAAFAARIETLAWMTPATKARARAKLASLKVGVGYPDTWQDYSDLEVIPGDAFGNAVRAETFHHQRNLKKLGHPPDRGEWGMTPQTVNAANMGPLNAFILPAAHLQPPFFDPRHTAAQDYGAMGAIIGHEISHSFDNRGARYDAEGRLDNGWSAADSDRFRLLGDALVRQFDAYRPFPDLAVNGRLTLGENIADLAGLAVAYDAYHLFLNGTNAPTVQGLTGDQQFFVSWAQTWRSWQSAATRRYLLVNDPHSPDEYRADIVRNLDAWYLAFGVEPGQKLYLAPKDRIKVW